MNVNNKPAVREVAWKTYKAETKRNLLSVFAIGMASFLIAVMSAVGTCYWDTLTERQLRMQGIDYDIELSEPTEKQVEIIRAMDTVKYAGLTVACMSVQQYKDQAVDYAKLYWSDEICWEKQIIPALEEYTGHYPEKEDELMLSDTLLQAMHIGHYEPGMKLPLSYTLMAASDTEEVVVREFILSGWYKDYTGMEKGYVSKAFYDATGVRQTDFGLGSLKISLVNPLYFAKDIAKMNKAAGTAGSQRITADDYAVPHFCKVIFALAGLFLMVIASAYLFIFNTMYMSISKNIRYYGQLKTIGMTSIQLKGTVYRQAFFNAAAGIMAGLAGAVFVSKTAVPKILLLAGGAYEESLIVPVKPWAFLAAGVFAMLVNLVSCRKPAKTAAECSPVEAMRYTAGAGTVGRKSHDTAGDKSGKTHDAEGDESRKVRCTTGIAGGKVRCMTGIAGGKVRCMTGIAARKVCNTTDKARRHEKASLLHMAWQNIFRDKKQAAVIFLSFTVALSVFFTINVAVFGNDVKHILNVTGRYDIRFINQTMLKNKKQVFTEEKIAALRAVDGVKTIRQVTSAFADIPYQEDVFGEFYRALYASRYSPGNYEEDMENYKKDTGRNFFGTRLVGIDEEGFASLNESLGNGMDQQAFENGEIAAALEFPMLPGDFGMQGKTVCFLLPEGLSPDTEYSTRIAAVSSRAVNYFGGGYTPCLVVSEKWMQQLLGETYTELIEIDYKEPYSQETEAAVKAVFSDEKKVTSSSKAERYESMTESETKIKVTGYSIGFMVAALALLNYINTMAAAVQNRGREFAILESVGMTRKQLHRMLCLEGIGYGLISAVCSLAMGIVCSHAVFEGLTSYKIPYAVPWGNTVVLYAAAICLCIVSPVVIFGLQQKGSVMERLQGS